MENNERNIIVSRFEIIPYDPFEFYCQDDEKCIGELTVDKAERTITFRHISGEKPILEFVISAMFVQKDWFKLIAEDRSIAERRGHFLLERHWPYEAYVVRSEEKNKPVIDHRIKLDDYCFIEELTLTPLEFGLLFESFTRFILYSTTSNRKRVLRWIKHDLEFRFIK